MAATRTAGYLVRHVKNAPTVPCPCGLSTRPLTVTDTPVCNLHVTFITDSVKHYHRETTEFLANYQRLRQILDEICAINRELLSRREAF